MKLNALQKEVDDWIKKYGVRYFNELTNMAQLTEEVGEVARIISRVYGEQSLKKDEKINDLGEELADVLFVLVCLANQTGIDLELITEIKNPLFYPLATTFVDLIKKKTINEYIGRINYLKISNNM